MLPIALTIAGSDPSGGAGLQADLKTFHQHGVYGTSVVTLLTVQNTQTVGEVRLVEAAFVEAQLQAVLDDMPPHAAKTGALGGGQTIATVAAAADELDVPLVVDPVMISKHGARLMAEDAADALTESLLPRAFLVTPNLPEAEVLCGFPVDDLASMERAARVISDRGVPNVLIKGGHLGGEAVDLLWSRGEVHRLVGRRVETPHTHGTGCVYSAAITARLARGESLAAAVRGAKHFISEAIRTHPGLGRGRGPTNMFASTDQ